MPPGRKPLPDVVHRLLREQVAFEADVAVAAVQHERIDQRVDDQVVLLVAGLEEVAAVVEVHEHARIVVRPIGMIALADALDHRIDFHGVDALGAPRQRAADVVAGSRADDQHLAERLGAGVAVEQVRQRVGGKRRVARLHLLVADQVDVDQSRGRVIVDAVVRRPLLPRTLGPRALRRDRQDQDQRRAEREDEATPAIVRERETTRSRP